jgi:hypothetical protein
MSAPGIRRPCASLSVVYRLLIYGLLAVGLFFTFLGLDRRGGLLVLRVGCLAMVFWGTIAHLDIVWNTADAAMGLMARATGWPLRSNSRKAYYIPQE